MKKTLTLLCLLVTFVDAYSQTCQNAGLGTNTPGSKLEIRGCTNTSSTSALNVTDSNASSIFYIRNDHAIGINTTSPASLFSIGSSSQFQVNSSGNLISINNVAYSWPTTQGAANTVLGNNGSGVLSWLSPFANPTALVGLSAVNGTASTAMRSDAAPALSQSIVPTWTGIHTFQNNNIGVTSTDEIVNQNNQAATSILNQWSPRIHYIGQGWKTNSTAASQTVDFIEELQTSTGTTNPTGNLVLSSQVNGGGYTNQFYFNSAGNLGIGASPTANYLLDATSSVNANNYIRLSNPNAGTAATSFLELSNGSKVVDLYIWGTGSVHPHPNAPGDVVISTTANGYLSLVGGAGTGSALTLSTGTLSAAGFSLFINGTGCTQIGVGAVSSSVAQLSIVAGTTTLAPLVINSGTLNTTAQAGAFGEYDGTNFYITATTGRGRQALIDGHTIFTPVTTGTVALVDNEINIINPAGTIAAATINFPSSPKNNDRVILKFTQTITTITWGNGTLVGGATTYVAGTSVIFTYDSGTTDWY